MKRTFSLLLSAALLLALLPACRETNRSRQSGRQPAASEVVNAMLSVSGYSGQPENLEYLTAEADETESLTV